MVQRWFLILAPLFIAGSSVLIILINSAYFPIFLNSKGQYKLVLWDASWNVGPFFSGLAFFSNKEGKFGYLDKQGSVKIPPIYDEAKCFNDGLAAVVKEGRECWIEKSGNVRVTLPPGFRTVGKVTSRNLILAKYIDPVSPEYMQLCFLGSDGTMRIKGPFREASDFSEGVASVETSPKDSFGKPKFYFINEGGKKVSSEFRSLDSMKEGLAAASILDNRGKERFGFVDKLGHYIIQPTYLNARAFQDGLAPVKTFWGWGFINKSNQFVIRPQFLDAKSFSEGLASVAIALKEKLAFFPEIADPNDSYGFIDRTGAWVIKPKFSRTESFEHGLAEVTELISVSPDEEAFSVVDRTGALIIPFRSDCVISCGENGWIGIHRKPQKH